MTEEIIKQRAVIAGLHHDLYQAKIHGAGFAKIEKLRKQLLAEEKKLNRMIFVEANR